MSNESFVHQGGRKMPKSLSQLIPQKIAGLAGAACVAPRIDPLPAFPGCVVALFMYDLRSRPARKNPDAAIEAFRCAAGDKQYAILIHKSNNGHVWPYAAARLQRALGRMANAYVTYDLLSFDQMKDLIAHTDIVVSLHRSEGFGLCSPSRWRRNPSSPSAGPTISIS